MIPEIIANHLRNTEAIHIYSSNELGGGCIHHAHRVESNKGTFFLKWNTKDQEHNFEVEEKGLYKLAETNTIHTPRPMQRGGVGNLVYLALEFIDQGQPKAKFWEHFGSQLALLHRNSSDYFGLEYNNYIGSLAQSNVQHSDWLRFFIEQRIQAVFQKAYDAGYFGKEWTSKFDQFFKQLEAYFPDEKPALIHGDLWGGNYMVNVQGEVSFFDPAIYYANREIELAFMTLFDRQPDNFYEAYNESFPLSPGWQNRLDTYNLYPLLVHVVLFGGGYVKSVKQIISRFQ